MTMKYTQKILLLVLVLFLLAPVSKIKTSTTVLGALTNDATATTAATASPEAELQPSPTPPPTIINPINLTVSPINLNLETDPGKPVSSSIRVFNNNTETEYLEIELAKFRADRSGSQPVIEHFETTDAYQHWMQFSENSFKVKPGEWKTVDVTFSPPREAALGYYYAVIVKRQQEVQAEATTVVTAAPAILVLANVYSPNAVQELQLAQLSVGKKMYEYLPVAFEVTVENTGNIHTSPLGNIFIDSASEKDVAVLSINKGNGLILPGTERSYPVKWDDGFPSYVPILEDGQEKKDAEGNTLYKLEWDLSKITHIRIGKYTAHLLLVYDNGERDVPIESEISFWVIPWKILLAGAVIIILIVLGIFLPLLAVWKKIRRKKTK